MENSSILLITAVATIIDELDIESLLKIYSL